MARSAGRAASLEIQTDGAAGSAGWDAVTVKRDVRVNQEAAEADLSGSELVDLTGVASLSLTVEAELVADSADTEFAAIEAAADAGTSIGVRVLDKAGVGGKGWLFDGVVTRWNWAGPRRDGQTVSATIKPAPGATPTRTTVIA